MKTSGPSLTCGDPAGKSPPPVDDACSFLAADQILAPWIQKLGPAPLGTRPPYLALTRAIVSQQLSTSASQAILGRLETRVGLDPQSISRAHVNTLRSVGLSLPKTRYVRNVARFTLEGGLDGLHQASDDEVVARLTSITGVGEWTAQMVMIFALGRPDVWPIGDVGIQRAARQLYRTRSERQLVRLGERFRPWRSHAAWYLWRSLEGQLGGRADGQ